MANTRPKKATKQVGIITTPERVNRLKAGARADLRDLGPWLLELGDARCAVLGIPEHVEPPTPPPLRPAAKKKPR